MKFKIIPIFVLFFGSLVQASADETLSDVDRFELWNFCKKLNLVVEDLSGFASEIGLTKESVENLVQSRLMEAGLFQDEFYSLPVLYTRVQVVDIAFSSEMYLIKELFDPTSNESGIAFTWQRDVVGTHGLSAEYILSVISEKTDLFIGEYLRVNASECNL